MRRAMWLAMAQMLSGRIILMLVNCVVLSALVFVGVYYGSSYGAAWLLGSSESALLKWMAGFATLALAWLLFPVVASLLIGVFLEHVCRVVEEEHYPDLPDAPGVTILKGVGIALSYTCALITGNVALLLLLVSFPAIYPVAWTLLNGYLLGREYVELIALRRLSPSEAKAIRRRHVGESTGAGAIFSVLMAIPLLNLIVPVFATAMTTHRFHDWQRHDAARNQA